MTGSVRVARILGIPIEIHFTWLFVFALIAWSLAAGYFPRVTPGLGMGALVLLGVAAALLFFGALLMHELAHSYVAVREGIPVRRITLFIFGGIAQMGQEPPSAGAEFRMTIAGPLMSLAIGGVFWALAALVALADPARPIALLFQYLAYINVAVAVFNLLPAFPLDGGRVLRSLIWQTTKSRLRATRIATTVGQGFAYLFVGFGVLRAFGGDVIGGLWMAFIGWFLLQAAQASYQQLLIRRALRGIEVRDIMREEIAAVPSRLSVEEFVRDHLLRSGESEFCVVDDGRVRGVITLEHVKRIERDHWGASTVEQAMTSEDRCPTIRDSQDAYDALMLLGSDPSPQILVRDRQQRFVGTVSRRDLIDHIRNRVALVA